MTRRTITAGGKKVELAESGKGAPLLYLHGFADVHGAAIDFLPFHEMLARSRHVIAPAHPACAGSDEDEDIETIDDLVFRYLEVLDALDLDAVDVVGSCVGGWIAAELAVRHRERVKSLALIGASGLMVPGKPIGDLFWEVQPRNGVDYSGLRALLFARADDPAALALFPDDRDEIARELNKYKMMRFASRIGFSPPYFFNRHLRGRLKRYQGAALVLAGAQDRMVPVEHARAYKDGLAHARLKLIDRAGHSPQVERPAETAAAVIAFLRVTAKSAPKPAAAKPKPKRR